MFVKLVQDASLMCLASFPVLDHVGYHELFDSDHLVIVDQLPRELMLEVVTSICDTLVEVRDFQSCFVSVVAAFLLT